MLYKEGDSVRLKTFRISSFEDPLYKCVTETGTGQSTTFVLPKEIIRACDLRSNVVIDCEVVFCRAIIVRNRTSRSKWVHREINISKTLRRNIYGRSDLLGINIWFYFENCMWFVPHQVVAII